MIEFTYSTRGQKCGGRWYPRPDRISAFLNIIKEPTDPVEDWLGFIAHICAVEFHELGHIYGYRGGCNSPTKCATGGCFWCNYVTVLFGILYSDFLMNEIGMQKRTCDTWSEFFNDRRV